MTNNDFIIRFRYAIDLPDHLVIKSFKEGGYDLKKEEIKAFFKKEDEEGFSKLNNKMLGVFLDGFIIVKRGKQNLKPGQKPKSPIPLTRNNINNEILKKIKISLTLHTDDLIEIFQCSGLTVSKSEIGSLLQKPEHKNYKECLDSYLRNFLKGLTIYYRNKK